MTWPEHRIATRLGSLDLGLREKFAKPLLAGFGEESVTWTLAFQSLIELDRDTLHTRLGRAHECHSGDGLCAFALVSLMPVGLALHGPVISIIIVHFYMQTVATFVFRCDTVLLFGPIGIELLLSKSVSLLEAIKCCVITALLCIGISVLVDSIMWQRILWPELEVFWFNSVLNRSSEWGVSLCYYYSLTSFLAT
uniref:Mannosyltransferase n=1 Tax=Ananas comosus var. bracteatus TaxID=296719 RepID=A0A6V7Q8Y5_ANACO|nr:unnamed protein product [Ananas comosus var. bracteatus]